MLYINQYDVIWESIKLLMSYCGSHGENHNSLSANKQTRGWPHKALFHYTSKRASHPQVQLYQTYVQANQQINHLIYIFAYRIVNTYVLILFCLFSSIRHKHQSCRIVHNRHKSVHGIVKRFWIYCKASLAAKSCNFSLSNQDNIYDFSAFYRTNDYHDYLLVKNITLDIS